MGKCTGLEPGSLRHRIELQHATATRNAYGEPIEAFATYATVWAAVEPLSMRERVQAEQMKAQRTHKITIRYLSGVVVTDRVVFGSRTFEVVSFLNHEERNYMMILECKEVA